MKVAIATDRGTSCYRRQHQRTVENTQREATIESTHRGHPPQASDGPPSRRPVGGDLLQVVKRSSDTRIRREVVGQLIESTANGTRYWPVEQLRALYETGCQARGTDPNAELRHSLGEAADVEAWWSQFPLPVSAAGSPSPPQLGHVRGFRPLTSTRSNGLPHSAQVSVSICTVPVVT